MKNLIALLTEGDLDAILICIILTLVSALITLLFSAIFGAILAYHARPKFQYWAALSLLFTPFAIGNSVGAYSVKRLISWIGIEDFLLGTDTCIRATALLVIVIFFKTIPLGVFFCATNLHRYTSEIRPYLQIHNIHLPFFIISALNRIPKSILMLLGLFGGGVMASESSLAHYLYRANGGTEPETMNILLNRLFREIYANTGPESLFQIAQLGLLISVFLMASAFLGTIIGLVFLRLFKKFLERIKLYSDQNILVTLIYPFGSIIYFLPGILILLGLYIPLKTLNPLNIDVLEKTLSYIDIMVLGALVGVAITAVSIALAVKLRYNSMDLLTCVENKRTAAIILMIPTFIPIPSIIAVLGQFSNGEMSGFIGYSSLYISHITLHYSVIQLICLAMIASIPERHVSWQRATKISYSFSLLTDGIKLNSVVIFGLIILCTVQVITDDSVSRWFSHLVNSPDAALQAAIFGRLSNQNEAGIIARSISVLTITACSILSAAYVRELANRPQYV